MIANIHEGIEPTLKAAIVVCNSFNMIDDLEKWKTLLAQTEVIYENTDHLWTQSSSQLLEYQNKTGVTLPSEYKEFCQIFGSGSFTKNEFQIFCPDPTDEGRGPVSSEDAIVAIKESYPYPEEVHELLDSSYMFGVGNGFIFFLFDLRTYSDLDKSYDIYLVDDEINNSVHYLGRSFFEFIQEMCLGERATLEFPMLKNRAESDDGDVTEDERFGFKP